MLFDLYKIQNTTKHISINVKANMPHICWIWGQTPLEFLESKEYFCEGISRQNLTTSSH